MAIMDLFFPPKPATSPTPPASAKPAVASKPIKR